MILEVTPPPDRKASMSAPTKQEVAAETVRRYLGKLADAASVLNVCDRVRITLVVSRTDRPGSLSFTELGFGDAAAVVKNETQLAIARNFEIRWEVTATLPTARIYSTGDLAYH